MYLQIHELQYYVEVSGTGTPLMLLHGFTGSHENWSGIAQQLSDQFKVVVVDLPGHGATDAPKNPVHYTIEATAADLIAICNALELDRMYLWGYSMGGRLALYTALHYPQRIRRLLLESASPGLADAQARLERVKSDELLADFIEREGIEAFVKRWESLPLWASQEQLAPEIRHRLHRLRLKNNPVGLANSLRGMGTGVQPSLWDQLDTLNVPVVITAGALDTKFVEIAKQMHARLPDSKLHIIPDAGHTIHLERPDVMTALCRTLLTS